MQLITRTMHTPCEYHTRIELHPNQLPDTTKATAAPASSAQETSNATRCVLPAFNFPVQLFCVIPRAAILSPRTTRLAAVLEQERVGGGLALTIAVMYEASLGPDSKW